MSDYVQQVEANEYAKSKQTAELTPDQNELLGRFSKAFDFSQRPKCEPLPVVEWKFPWNPRHPIGTCQQCGGEMVYNVPRLGPDGGYVHKETGKLLCQ